MSDDLWIIIPNWDKFQHYGDRMPPWIKVYLELNRRDDWRNLSYAARGQLVSLWVEYAAVRGQLPLRNLGALCGQKTDSRTLKALSDAGFIAFSASKPLALEKRREEKKEKPSRSRAEKPKTAPAEPRVNAGAYQPFERELEPFDEAAVIARLTEQARRH